MWTQELLKKHRLMLIAGAFIFLALAVQVLKNPVYQAECLIRVDLKQGPASLETKLMGNDLVERMMRMHVHLLTSDPALLAVVKELHLAGGPEADEPSIRKAAERLRGESIKITSPVFTNLIKISVTGADPRQAAKVANALALQYKRWLAEADEQEAKEMAAYLDAQIMKIRDKPRRGSEASAQAEYIKYLFQERLRAEMLIERKTPGNIRVVSPAVPPSGPIGGKRSLAVALMVSGFFAFLIGMGSVMIEKYFLINFRKS